MLRDGKIDRETLTTLYGLTEYGDKDDPKRYHGLEALAQTAPQTHTHGIKTIFQIKPEEYRAKFLVGPPGFESVLSWWVVCFAGVVVVFVWLFQFFCIRFYSQGFDATFEVSGNAEVINTAINITRPRGFIHLKSTPCMNNSLDP